MKKYRKRLLSALLAAALILLQTTPLQAEKQPKIRMLQASDWQDSEEKQEDPNITFLLIGQDGRPDTPGKRSDSMILCTFQPSQKKLVMTSILRDLYVKIPGYGYERINAAYALGGRELLKETLKENLGIIPDGTLEVDFGRFSGIIDTLGGVTLELRRDEVQEINTLVPEGSLKPGIQKMNGRQTLAYARIRNLDADSDFSRTLRQRKVLEALTDQFRNLSFPDMVLLIRKLIPAVDTDLSGFALLTYGKMLLPLLKDLQVEGRQIPDPSSCSDRKIRGMWVLYPDLPRIRSQMEDLFS